MHPVPTNETQYLAAKRNLRIALAQAFHQLETTRDLEDALVMELTIAKILDAYAYNHHGWMMQQRNAQEASDVE